MDYHAVHGYDVASFDAPNIHRLPTISASQALDELKDDHAARISTGLGALDDALLSLEPVDSQDTTRNGGIKRGQVTEVWGPPGSGRTAFGIQLTANTLRDGHGVIWVDCFQNIQTQRVSQVLKSVTEAAHKAGTGQNTTQQAVEPGGTFTQYSCETLPHLLAFVSRPTTSIIPKTVSLIVISGLSALINTSLPRSLDGKAVSKPGKGKGPTPSMKRLQGLQFIISGLQKLAATRNLAAVLLSQCATSMKSEQGATLVPAINATVWEQAVSTRVVLFRDWSWHEKKSTSVFLAGLQKIDGRIIQGAIEHVSAFKIDLTGISDVRYEANHQSLAHEVVVSIAVTPRPKKRKRGPSDLEVADSEDDGEGDGDEDYGWAEEDEDALPPPPSQWQGSEDLILGHDVGLSDEDLDDEAAGEAPSMEEAETQD